MAAAGDRINRPTRILLVDDHVDMVTVFCHLLRGYGFEVLVAYSMREALDVAAHSPCDLLISDIGLPDGNGIELLRQLTQDGPMPAIAVSGFGTHDDVRRSYDAGFAAHLVKPFDLGKLRETITRLLYDEESCAPKQ